ncbi:MAG TPA: glycosyltransferase [Gemmatimonadales bacterium]|nr:glycosyltransferase [Gemmatimonadales bacterium]
MPAPVSSATAAEPRQVAQRALRVLAWPGLGARRSNPYTWLLYSHLAPLGVRTEDFTFARALRGGYDVLHLHWPDKALNARWLPVRAAGAAGALAVIAAARRHGARVVWTAHNAKPHESRHPRLERRFWTAVVGGVDGVIHLSQAGQRMVEARYPALAARPSAVMSPGHFRGSYPDTITRAQARAALDLPARARVVVFFGLIRVYKGVSHLVRTVRALPDDVVLLVAGAPQPASLASELRAAAGDDPRIRLALGHVPDDRVQEYLRAADLVVLPFRDITNSGSALLALGFDRPVLVPARGAMGELQALAGTDWVRTYDGELAPALLAEALSWARWERIPASPPLDALDWSRVAAQTLRFYRELER